MTAPLYGRGDRCRACGYLPDEHDDKTCPVTRVPGFTRRGPGPRRKRKPDFVDVPLPGARQWNTDGKFADICGCRPLTPNSSEQEKKIP